MRGRMGILSLLFGMVVAPKTVYADTSEFIVLDVRTPFEYSEVHVKGSLNIDFLNKNFKMNVLRLDKLKIYKVYCRSGNRSSQAERLMKSLGFKDVENLGSVNQASKKLNIACEGKTSC